MTSPANTYNRFFSRPYTFDRVIRLLIGMFVFAAILWLVKVLKGVLLPFLVAWLIAYMLEPFVQYNKRLLRVKTRWLPILMTLFESCLLLCALCVFVVPSVYEEMHQVAVLVRNYADKGSEIPFIPSYIHDFIKEYIDFNKIAGDLTSQDIRSIMEAAGSVIAGSYSIVVDIFSWFLVLLYVVFIMLDYEKLLKGFRRLVPPKYRNTTGRILHDVKESMNHYFRGQALIAFIVGILFCVGFSIINLPLAIVLGLFIGLLNMVPYLQLISLIPTTILCLVYSVDSNVNFWNIWLASMAVYIIIQCIQDLFLTPRIMGRAMGLNPAIILLSLSIWGTLFGFIGLIIALPLTTLLLAYYNNYIINREDGESEAEKEKDALALKNIVKSPEDSED